MKTIPISRGLFTIVDDCDYDWLVNKGKWTAFDCKSGFYAGRVECSHGSRELQMMARLIENPSSGLIVDHKNGNTLDNRRENLRAVTRGFNRRNKHNLQTNNASGYEGVWFDPKQGKYIAYITKDGVQIHLGTFESKLEAVTARMLEFTRITEEEICQTSSLHQNNLRFLQQFVKRTPL